MTREEAINEIKSWAIPSKKGREVLETLIPELAESEDEKIRKEINILYSDIDTCISELLKARTDKDSEAEGKALFKMEGLMVATLQDLSCIENYLEKQKDQKPIIQDVELNDAVYDYVREHFIAGADFTPEYIKKLMENAFFAGVDYYLLKQESESCEPDTNVEKVIEDVIRVYGKTQGKWVGGYDVDTLIVNLRRAFNKKEQKPAEWSEEDENNLELVIDCIYKFYPDPVMKYKLKEWLKSLRLQPKQNVNDMIITPNKEFFQWIYDRLVNVHNENPNVDYMISFKRRIEELSVDKPSWKPSEEQIKALYCALNDAISLYSDKVSPLYEEISRTHFDALESLYNDLKKL